MNAQDYARYWQYAAVPLFVSFALSDMQDDGHQQFQLERLDSDISIFGQCWAVGNAGLTLI